jgi:AcrR family transcriptional regulator
MPRRPVVTRDRIVDVAATLVDDEGLAALSLARVAGVVGVRAPSLYNHLGGLEDLRGALRLRALEQLERSLQRATVGRAGRDALGAMAGAYRDFAHEHPGLYPLTLGAGGREPAAARDAEAADAAASQLVDLVLSVLRGYQLEGDEALHATRALRSSLHGFVSLENAGAFGLPLALDASFARLIDMHDAAMSGEGRAGQLQGRS